MESASNEEGGPNMWAITAKRRSFLTVAKKDCGTILPTITSVIFTDSTNPAPKEST